MILYTYMRAANYEKAQKNNEDERDKESTGTKARRLFTKN